MQSQCGMYNQCSNQGKRNLQYPIDKNSLYARKINDNQTVNRRCYERHPVNIIEGFGKNASIFNILLWIVGICILIVASMYLMERFNMKKVALSETVMEGQTGGGCPICPMSDTFDFTERGTMNLRGGGIKHSGDLLDFLFTD